MNYRTKDLSVVWQSCLMVILSAVIITMPDFAQASPVVENDTPISQELCTVSAWFLGNTAKGLATVAITIIGVNALLGKVTWGTAITVGMLILPVPRHTRSGARRRCLATILPVRRITRGPGVRLPSPARMVRPNGYDDGALGGLVHGRASRARRDTRLSRAHFPVHG
jgi:type IV secretory pathway VirB2 component (pilin)